MINATKKKVDTVQKVDYVKALKWALDWLNRKKNRKQQKYQICREYAEISSTPMFVHVQINVSNIKPSLLLWFVSSMADWSFSYCKCVHQLRFSFTCATVSFDHCWCHSFRSHRNFQRCCIVYMFDIVSLYNRRAQFTFQHFFSFSLSFSNHMSLVLI